MICILVFMIYCKKKTFEKCLLFKCLGTYFGVLKGTSKWYWHRLLTNLSNSLCFITHSILIYSRAFFLALWSASRSPLGLYCLTLFQWAVRLPALLGLGKIPTFSPRRLRNVTSIWNTCLFWFQSFTRVLVLALGFLETPVDPDINVPFLLEPI